MSRPFLLAVLIFTLSSVAWSQTPLGDEFQVSTTTPSYFSTVAMGEDGDFVVVWLGQYTEPAAAPICCVFLQQFDSDGSRHGVEVELHRYPQGLQVASVAMNQDGDFVVAWQNVDQRRGDYGIAGQAFRSSGTPMGSQFQISSSYRDTKGLPTVAIAADGDFVVVWVESRGLIGQRFSPNGTRVAEEFQVNTHTTGTPFSHSVAIQANGEFVVVWDSTPAYQFPGGPFEDGGPDGDGMGIFGQRFSSDGRSLGTEFIVNSYTTDAQRQPSVAMSPNGEFVVVWNSDPGLSPSGEAQDGDGFGVFGQRFNSNGTPIGGEFQVNSYTTSHQYLSWHAPSVAMNSNGNFVVVWYGPGADGQAFDWNGNRVGREFQTTFFGGEAVAMDQFGDFVVIGTGSTDPFSGTAIFGQRFRLNDMTISITGNETEFHAGDTLHVAVQVLNPGSSSVIDFYFGALLPDLDTLVVFTDLSFNASTCSLSKLETCAPMISRLDLSQRFAARLPSFFSYTWRGSEPPGPYKLFQAAVIPGGFADGNVDPGDILAIDTASLTFAGPTPPRP